MFVQLLMVITVLVKSGTSEALGELGSVGTAVAGRGGDELARQRAVGKREAERGSATQVGGDIGGPEECLALPKAGRIAGGVGEELEMGGVDAVELVMDP